MLPIREIAFGSEDYRKLLNLRYEVLRKPLGMEMRPKDTAMDAQEHHIAVWDAQTPIGCVQLRPLQDKAVQLRQMSILPEWQGQGIGARLVTFAEDFAREKGFACIKARARKNVLKFYEKLGYTPRADIFEDEHTLNVIKHL